MDNVVLIETAWGDQDIAIQIERTAEMTTAARELSDCIKGLPLTAEQNNTLVPLIVKQVQEAERGAFPCLPGLWTALPFCVIFQTGHAGCTRTPIDGICSASSDTSSATESGLWKIWAGYSARRNRD